MPATVGTCRLCGEERPLLRASHLVPSALYRHMKPGAARFGMSGGACSTAEPAVGGLLCAACDNDLLGRLDFVGHHVLAERLPGARSDGDALVVEPVSYGPLKLFLWSVLWRAAISGDPRFAPLAAVLPIEDLRQRLLAADPGEPDLYPVTVAIDDRAAAPECLSPWGHSSWLVAGRYRFGWGAGMSLDRTSLRLLRLS